MLCHAVEEKIDNDEVSSVESYVTLATASVTSLPLPLRDQIREEEDVETQGDAASVNGSVDCCFKRKRS